MSASLVGSEMCIRDSTMGMPIQLDNRPEAPGHPAGESRRGTLERYIAAVSYTHLTLPTICSV
eukprot:6233969-Alexandrium_andersonii.AAC.1